MHVAGDWFGPRTRCGGAFGSSLCGKSATLSNDLDQTHCRWLSGRVALILFMSTTHFFPGSRPREPGFFVRSYSAASIACLRTFGVLVNRNNVPAELHAKELQAAAPTTGQQLIVLGASSDADFVELFTECVRQRTDGLIIVPDPFFDSRRDQLVDMATSAGIFVTRILQSQSRGRPLHSVMAVLQNVTMLSMRVGSLAGSGDGGAAVASPSTVPATASWPGRSPRRHPSRAAAPGSIRTMASA
jgi:hypothetical protein